jgi:hypothetical protein
MPSASIDTPAMAPKSPICLRVMNVLPPRARLFVLLEFPGLRLRALTRKVRLTGVSDICNIGGNAAPRFKVNFASRRYPQEDLGFPEPDQPPQDL